VKSKKRKQVKKNKRQYGAGWEAGRHFLIKASCGKFSQIFIPIV